MKTIAFVLYPGITPLDLVGPLEVMTVLSTVSPDYETVVVAERTGPMETETAVSLSASHTFEEVPDPHVLIVPGGNAPTMRAMTDEKLLGYLRAVSPAMLGSVCTGALILAAAGLLKSREATTHWAFLDTLEEFGAIPVSRRWVEDGPVVTAAGVSAGIDMALHLVTRLAGAEMSRMIQYGIEYDPAPPAGPLDWRSAPREFFTGFARAVVSEGLADHDSLRGRMLGRL